MTSALRRSIFRIRPSALGQTILCATQRQQVMKRIPPSSRPKQHAGPAPIDADEADWWHHDADADSDHMSSYSQKSMRELEEEQRIHDELMMKLSVLALKRADPAADVDPLAPLSEWTEAQLLAAVAFIDDFLRVNQHEQPFSVLDGQSSTTPEAPALVLHQLEQPDSEQKQPANSNQLASPTMTRTATLTLRLQRRGRAQDARRCCVIM